MILFEKLHYFLIDDLNLSPMWTDRIKELTATLFLIGLAILCNYVIRVILAPPVRNYCRNTNSNLLALVVRYRFFYHFVHALAGGIILAVLPYVLDFSPTLLHIADLGTESYIIITILLVINAAIQILHEQYTHKKGNTGHSLTGLVQICQVTLFFVGAILIIAVLFDKSPATLFAGLGASAAILMLVFKDTILGFVAGVQLSANDMVRIGDWIQMPDGSANGIVLEVTLNTVKIRNWDNTISTIPPYTLVNSAFQNWRGMKESGGRRVNKLLYFDIESIKVLAPQQIENLIKNYPVLQNQPHTTTSKITNLQLFRYFLENHLAQHPEINPEMDIIISEKEPGPKGLPVQVYFFLRNKNWKEYEHIQSDIFDQLFIVATDFGLKLYQYPKQLPMPNEENMAHPISHGQNR